MGRAGQSRGTGIGPGPAAWLCSVLQIDEVDTDCEEKEKQVRLSSDLRNNSTFENRNQIESCVQFDDGRTGVAGRGTGDHGSCNAD